MSIFKERDPSRGRTVVRELARFKRFLAGQIAWIRYRRLQRTYDANWAANVLVTDGQRPQLPKVAIVVMFQPRGVRASFLDTLDHLCAQGYAVMLMSNAPLTKDDVAQVSPLVWKICTRPNYGYDLGAYRDGVWMLERAGVRLSNVILMNDSIWFPLQPDTTVIARLEACGHGLTGLVRKTKAKNDAAATSDTGGFIEAYFYLANLSDPSFRAWWDGFWQRVGLTEGRMHLREGKVSHSATKAGFPFYTIASRRLFLEKMAALPDAELLQVLRFAAYPTAALELEGENLLNSATGSNWRASVLRHIGAAVRQDPFYAVFPYGSNRAFGLGFMKRTRKPLFEDMHNVYLRAVTSGVFPPPHARTLADIEAACRARAT